MNLTVNNALMKTTLASYVKADEKLLYPIYAVFKSTSFWARANSMYPGFAAVTDRNVFIYSAVGIGSGRLELQNLKTVRVTKNIFGQSSFELTFNENGKNQKFIFNAAKKIYMSDLDKQGENLAFLTDELKNWNTGRRYI